MHLSDRKYLYKLYLAEFLDHFLDADVSVSGHFALHVGKPLTEFLVSFIKHRPFVQLFADLLLAE